VHGQGLRAQDRAARAGGGPPTEAAPSHGWPRLGCAPQPRAEGHAEAAPEGRALAGPPGRGPRGGGDQLVNEREGSEERGAHHRLDEQQQPLIGIQPRARSEVERGGREGGYYAAKRE
jgi:hypothetical protein